MGRSGARAGAADLGSTAALAAARAWDGDDDVIMIRLGTRTTIYGVPR